MMRFLQLTQFVINHVLLGSFVALISLMCMYFSVRVGNSNKTCSDSYRFNTSIGLLFLSHLPMTTIHYACLNWALLLPYSYFLHYQLPILYTLFNLKLIQFLTLHNFKSTFSTYVSSTIIL